jgi:hypothetical protein
MKIIKTFLFLFCFNFLFSQVKFTKRVTINGNEIQPYENVTIVFPLLKYSIEIDRISQLSFDTSDFKQKYFYCVINNERSRIFNLNNTIINGSVINFNIPDANYYDSLHKIKICPYCKSSSLTRIIYGKPGNELLLDAERGEVRLGGCTINRTSPNFYCKTDNIEF